MELNRNPEDFFAEVEQAAFNPANSSARSCRSPRSMRSGFGGDLGGHCLARGLQSRVLLDVVRREDFVGRLDFRQYIDDAVGPGKSWVHYVHEEFRRNIDAAIGNTVVERRRSGQALKSALLGTGRSHRMQGDGTVVVHPENFLSAEIAV